ncbi:MAG: DUF6252 family protein [Cellulophaga sp.]|nr:DUF6252 family protein [Cellulophaga sp.]
MKTTIKTLFFLVIFSTLSCSGNDEKQASSKNTFFAKIDGVDYSPESVTGFDQSFTNSLLLTGATGTNAETIQMLIPNDIAVGSYTDLYNPLADNFLQIYYSPPNSNEATDDGIAASGNITITRHDIDTKTIEGTFSFVTEPAESSGISWNITDGSFKITYTEL